ncbi:MAG: cation:proton antiporter, partial [Chitinophagaceae bacterium]|nr:cation:proton antiporter [Chitinophagaceae bacterium]
MDYFLALTMVGLAALGMAWMPAITSKLRISYSLIYLILGIGLYSIFDNLPAPDPFLYPDITVHFTELVVVVALMGTGLKIDQNFTFSNWKLPLRLVTFSMVACIGLMALFSGSFLGLDEASALLLAAVLAPTDPVLASDVQVGPPSQGEKEMVRFALTAEGGMNDGTAFPFVWLAIYMALQQSGADVSFLEWFGFNVIYKLAVALLAGLLLGRALGYLLFKLPEKFQSIKI